MFSPRALAPVLVLAVGLPTGAAAGPIRHTAQMGPMARRVLSEMRKERKARDEARILARLRKRIAVVRVRTRGEDFDLSTRVARAFEDELRARGFLVRPYRKVWPRIRKAEEELFATSHSLRQLARKLRVGRLLLVDVREFRVADGHTAGFAVPSWWGKGELDQEFAEVHLHLEVFDASKGEFVVDRQDRQHRQVPRLGGEGHEHSMRDPALADVLAFTVSHVLHDLHPPGPPVPTKGYPPSVTVARQARRERRAGRAEAARGAASATAISPGEGGQ